MACRGDLEDEFGRPAWELEAEILRLTTRVMMMEREMRQMRQQMALQAAQMREAEETWKSRIRQQEERVRQILLQKDKEMQQISSQLLVFESGLRKEQIRIELLLQEKDNIINSQKEEMHKLELSFFTPSKESEVNHKDVPFEEVVHESKNVLPENDHSKFVDNYPSKLSKKSIDESQIIRNGPCHDVTNVWPHLSAEIIAENAMSTSGPGSCQTNVYTITTNRQIPRVKPKVLPKPKHLQTLSAQRKNMPMAEFQVYTDKVDSNSSDNDNSIVQSNNCALVDVKTKALKRRYAKKQRSTAQIIDGVGLVESKGW